MMRQRSRRSFIQYASLAAAGSALALRPFGKLSALAQGASDYKALVCIFLYGGNDSNNMLVPFDTAGYASYAAVRGPLTIPQADLLQLAALPGFALNNNMPELAALFNSQALAAIVNTGTLIQPTTKTSFLAGGDLPNNLFSHADQQLEWQNAAQDSAVATGWAGRMSDLLGNTYNKAAGIPMITSVAGDTLFCNGQTSTPVSISPGKLGAAQCYESAAECTAEQGVAQSLLTFDTGLSLVQADNLITNHAYSYAATLASAVSSVHPLKTVFPANNPLALQLGQIAQIIQVRAALGVQRQIFFAGIGDFDTHADQVTRQSALLAQISSALGAFYQSTQELGVADQITTFTMSDFSRTLQPNSNTGSDHAWGSHHLVMGGAVKGGQMYGTFPTLALSGPDDSGKNGRWVPSTASVQYAATLANWFGVSPAQMQTILPNIVNFPVANLGFI